MRRGGVKCFSLSLLRPPQGPLIHRTSFTPPDCYQTPPTPKKCSCSSLDENQPELNSHFICASRELRAVNAAGCPSIPALGGDLVLPALHGHPQLYIADLLGSYSCSPRLVGHLTGIYLLSLGLFSKAEATPPPAPTHPL